MMIHRRRRALALAASVACLGPWAHPAHAAPARPIEEQIGFATHPDWERLGRIETGVGRTGRLSDGDLAWLTRLMAAAPPVPNAANEDIRRDYVMRVFREVRSPPPAQEEAMYRAVLPLLSSASFRQRAVAARVMGSLGDRRSVPALRLLQRDPNAAVRGAAGRSLLSMGLP